MFPFILSMGMMLMYSHPMLPTGMHLELPIEALVPTMSCRYQRKKVVAKKAVKKLPFYFSLSFKKGKKGKFNAK